MIKNVIFDLGNVILNFNPKEHVKSKITEEKVEEIYECIFLSEEWPMLDRGTIDEENARKNIAGRNIANEDLINKVFDNWYDMLIPIESSVRLLKELKENGYNIYYLSNFHAAAFEYINDKYDFLRIFDGGVFSFKEKLLKPEKEIYNRIIEKYDLDPRETVFVDDLEINVEAAKKLGLEGIVLDNPENLEDKLRTYNINF